MPERQQPIWETDPKWWEKDDEDLTLFNAHLQYTKARLEIGRKRREYLQEANGLEDLKARLELLKEQGEVTEMFGFSIYALKEIIEEILEIFRIQEELNFEAAAYFVGEGKITSPEQAGESFYQRHFTEEKVLEKTTTEDLESQLGGLVHFQTNPEGARKFFDLIKAVVGLAVIQRINSK